MTDLLSVYRETEREDSLSEPESLLMEIRLPEGWGQLRVVESLWERGALFFSARNILGRTKTVEWRPNLLRVFRETDPNKARAVVKGEIEALLQANFPSMDALDVWRAACEETSCH